MHSRVRFKNEKEVIIEAEVGVVHFKNGEGMTSEEMRVVSRRCKMQGNGSFPEIFRMNKALSTP